ncbi:copper resistance protein CopC [Micromonospora sp. NPDC049366]|uniref:copper resistance protein CopC n=1 Tax=Micromonospora sp. NPDC049366 TaxID=3364271 RepID=UPI00379C82EC
MRRLRSAVPRAVAGLLALVLAAAVGVLMSAPPAAAHGTLAMSTPAEGATVDGPLTEVRLYFTEKVAPNAYFAITGPGGGRVDNGWSQGEPRPLDKPVREYFLVDGTFEPREYTTGFPAVVVIAHLPAPGRYSVSYLSMASDGDPVRGTLTFRYTGRATAAPHGWQPPTNQPDPTLLAAAEGHGTSGHDSGGSSTAPAAPAAPTAAAAPDAAAPDPGDEGGAGWLMWVGWVTVTAVVVAGLLLWRRRPASAGRTANRARPARPSSGRAAGSRSGGGSGAAGRAGGGRKGAPSGSGGKGRPAVVPAARSGGTTVTTAAVPSAAPARVSARGVATADPEPADATGGPPTGADDHSPGGATRLTNTRIALLVGGLVVALLAGFGLGRLGAAGTTTAAGAPTAPAGGAPGQAVSAGDGHQHAPGTGAHTHPGDAAAGPATGTAVSAGGYTLQPLERTQPAGATVDYRFRVIGADRQPATRFAVVHDKPLHLVVVGRDLGGYQHLHPTMAADGTWSVPLTLARPGGYRIYADFSVTTAEGTQLPLVLGVDHVVPGAHTPTVLPPPQPQATAGPFTVSMEGTPTVGVTTPMVFRVARSGAPVSLQRYLGAYGHLVVVREGDLGYVHVHPEAELVDGAVTFWLTAPSPGRYRAFFDFQVDGTVYTAEYTINLA